MCTTTSICHNTSQVTESVYLMIYLFYCPMPIFYHSQYFLTITIFLVSALVIRAIHSASVPNAHGWTEVRCAMWIFNSELWLAVHYNGIVCSTAKPLYRVYRTAELQHSWYVKCGTENCDQPNLEPLTWSVYKKNSSNNDELDWIEQGLMSHSTHFRSFRRRATMMMMMVMVVVVVTEVTQSHNC